MRGDASIGLEDCAEDAPLDYDRLHCWEDQRLVETYRRLSLDLHRRGFDVRTVDRMGRVEVELRARQLDPDRIARAVAEVLDEAKC